LVRTVLSPARIRSSSSTTSTRICSSGMDVGKVYMDVESSLDDRCFETAGEEGGAFPHAEDAVAGLAVLVRVAGGEGGGDGELELVLGVPDLDVGGAVAVAGGVGERLLQNAVCGLVDARGQRLSRAFDCEVDGEAGGAAAFEQRVEGGEAGWRLRLAVDVFAEGSH